MSTKEVIVYTADSPCGRTRMSLHPFDGSLPMAHQDCDGTRDVGYEHRVVWDASIPAGWTRWAVSCRGADGHPDGPCVGDSEFVVGAYGRNWGKGPRGSIEAALDWLLEGEVAQ